ncbi:MAG: hypothetical protein WA055_00520 [Candidatus Moraniibacteriota bacterium]
MNTKKSFKIYYLLLVEGTTEFNLFAYLTKNKFRDDFEKSNIKFSDKINITDIGISKGKLNGFGNLSSFKRKYNSIKKDIAYKGEKLFFVIDKDLNDSLAIEKLIKENNDIVQFVEYNSEYLLLRFGGKNPKRPSDFTNLADFRNYCKSEFQKQFKKKASEFKDYDFDLVFSNIEDIKIRKSFSELFSTLQ